MSPQPPAQASIIGWAWRTSLGAQVDAVMARLRRGERGVAAYDVFGAEHGYQCKLAAVIPGQPAPSRHQRFARRMDLFGVEVAVEAARDAGLTPPEQRLDVPSELGPRVGVFMGYGGLRAHWDELMPSLKHQREDERALWERGLRQFHPFWMLRHLSNNAQALAAQQLGARGEGLTLGGANGGAQALGAAATALAQGHLDVAIVAAYDSLVQPDTLVELGLRGALSHAPTPQALRSPYTPEACGVAPAEAAAAVVLVRPEDAPPGAERARVRALDADAQRVEAHPASLRWAVAPLLEGLGPVSLIDGAALAQPELDLAERQVWDALCGPHVPLLALRDQLGHMGAATTIIQAIALSWRLHRQLSDAPDAPDASGASLAAIGVSLTAPGLIGATRVEVLPSPALARPQDAPPAPQT